MPRSSKSTDERQKPVLKVALAQMNPLLGDIGKNSETILGFIQRAHAQGCDLVIFPELALLGYPPADLLERSQIADDCRSALDQIKQKMPESISALIGTVQTASDGQSKKQLGRGRKSLAGVLQNRADKRLLNSVALLSRRAHQIRFFSKTRLPQYDVFDESRHFRSAYQPLSSNQSAQAALRRHFLKQRVRMKGFTIQISICEDIWGWGLEDNELVFAPNKGTHSVDLVVNCSASPFSLTKEKQRCEVLTKTVEHFDAPVIYVNAVGAQDEIIFDGNSMLAAVEPWSARKTRDRQKSPLRFHSLSRFSEDLGIVLFQKQPGRVRAEKVRSTAARVQLTESEILKSALVLGVRDYVHKIGLKKVVLGMSGGVDSAVVACLASEAIGVENVLGVAMPGPFSSPQSLALAEEQARLMGIELKHWTVTKHYESFVRELESVVGNRPFGLVHENLQARLRAVVLMMFSNLENRLLLSTSNKSELASGYSTLYGDQCGGLAPLGDCLKQQVVQLAELYRKMGWIPQEVINRPPTAELRPNQRDEDTLPKYADLDRAVVRVVEQSLTAKGPVDEFVLNALYRNEFKRWQAPPILRVSDHAFGRGRRFPIAHRYKK